ncbi:hypothetical protein CK501_06705 [Halovibrio salipaludis]|uniref:Uncharacterized protein n=1 Tax=Halovibrio salipaludis TaxID=2032626 RepID=A0A2A2F9G4_9GAMM|nr:hypothetical protein [Halovibrio salipaludis]PAU81242.1 hypothetical protein CK501_06705 [Halovibrio salipaludis]
MRTLTPRTLCCRIATLTLLPLAASMASAQQMANPESDAASARAQQQQQAERTTRPLSLKIQQEGNVRTPRRGESMGSVQDRFGDPEARQGPVGEPPITRWQYPRFVVVFEGEWVIDTVVEPDSSD